MMSSKTGTILIISGSNARVEFVPFKQGRRFCPAHVSGTQTQLSVFMCVTCSGDSDG